MVAVSRMVALPAVGKITGKEGLLFEGRALCFDCEEDMLAALEQDQEQFKVRCVGEGARLAQAKPGKGL